MNDLTKIIIVDMGKKNKRGIIDRERQRIKYILMKRDY